MSRVYNLSAGPAVLPEEVLEEIAAEVMNYHGSGMSVMEMSHRSKVYQQIPEVSFRFVDDPLVSLGTMAHLHNGHTGALIVEHLGGSFFQHLFRQDRGTCG